MKKVCVFFVWRFLMFGSESAGCAAGVLETKTDVLYDSSFLLLVTVLAAIIVSQAGVETKKLSVVHDEGTLYKFTIA